MALAVRERTREVGILKSLGFSPGKVILLVLAEGIALTLPGGVAGLFLAWLGARGLYQVPEIRGFFPNLTVTAEIAICCLSTAAAVGLLTGLFPALRAARLKIADAFRHVG
jgi:putative ABC transport system permease protein